MRARARTARAAAVLAAMEIGVLGVLGCDGGAPRSERGVRVVLITLDTLRLDSFERDMPLTRARAEGGLVFANHYAASSTTLPTHASMLTGLHPWEHGATANGRVLGPQCETVAERLRAAGFRTAAVVASFPLHGRFGLERGFDLYHNEFGDDYSNAERINRRALEVLDGLGGERQFVWFHYFDAHAPYGDTQQPESNFYPRVLAKRIHGVPAERDFILAKSRELYDVDVASLDRALQELFARLAAESERFETHVVVASDHGEAFGEGGAFGHGQRLVPAQIHVPLFVLSPRVAPGVRDEPVGSVDVAATLLALAGLAPDLAGADDLTGALDADRTVRGMRRTFDGPAQEHRVDGTVEALDPHWFFLARRGQVFTGNSDRITLDDSGAVVADARVADPLRAEFGELARALDGLPRIELDEETLKALERLGYTH